MTIDFAAPQWFVLSLILPMLAGLKWWSRSRAAAAVDGMVARRLQAQLVRRHPWWADWTGFGLQLLALLAFITALARPQWGFQQVQTSTAERNVFIAIDTSRSMLAEDVRPNRLERAKLLAQDLVRKLPTDRVGVIAFAGKAFVQAPLTVDHDAVLETIAQLDVEVIPRGGTNLAGPALLALESMKETETSLAALVLFSDGEDLEGSQDRTRLAKAIEASRLLVISIGAGTTSGGIIPDPETPGQFLKDANGQIVRTKLSPAALRELSDVSGGVYVDMGSEESVTSVIQQALRKLESAQLRAEDVRIPHERYAIPLAAGMFFLFLSHLWPLLTGMSSPARPRARSVESSRSKLGARSPAVLLSLVTALQLLGSEPASAASAEWDRALQAFREGAFEDAQEHFSAAVAKSKLALLREHGHFGVGAAAYRAGDFETAKEAFSQALLTPERGLREKAHYNLANALFESGRLLAQTKREAALAQWECAIEHYDSALALNPKSTATQRNRLFVEELLNQLRQEPPPEEQPKPDEPQDEQQKDQDEKAQDPESPPPPEQPDQPKPEEPPAGPEDPSKPDDDKKEKDEPPTPEPGQEPPPAPTPQPWNPAQARQILEQNAGEDLNAKPVQLVPFSSQPFKNW